MPKDERDDHHEFGPSRLPYLALCPRYKSGEVGEAAKSGTRQHSALEQLIKGLPVEVEGLTDEEYDNASWAASHILTMADGAEIMSEVKLTMVEDFEEVLYGRADIMWTTEGGNLVLIDYKSGQKRDYTWQMSAYARMAMQLFGMRRCAVVELYGTLRDEVTRVVNYDETDKVLDIIAKAKDPESKPTTCDYCCWCVNQPTCEAVQREVVKVATGYEPETAIENWHCSEVTDPRQIAEGLRLADVVEKWAKSWKHHAKQAMLDGMEVPGYRIARIPSKEFGKEIKPGQVFTASGLSVDRFADCCDIGITKLREAVANDIGLKTASGKKAKEEFSSRFGALLSDKEIIRLEKEKSNGNAE